MYRYISELPIDQNSSTLPYITQYTNLYDVPGSKTVWHLLFEVSFSIPF